MNIRHRSVDRIADDIRHRIVCGNRVGCQGSSHRFCGQGADRPENE